MASVIKPVGLTKNGGYEFGLRTTFRVKPSEAWKFLMSPEGIRLWLGESDDFIVEKDAEFHLTGGITGTVTTVNPEVNIRLTWQPAGWAKPSIVQLRVIPAGEKTTVSFHHENLPDAASREQMRQHWQKVMEDLVEAMKIPC